MGVPLANAAEAKNSTYTAPKHTAAYHRNERYIARGL